MSRILVALFNDRAKAEPIQQRLLQAGVVAEIHDELRLEKLWFVPKQGAGVRVEVSANQFERAKRLLLDWDAAEGLLSEAIRCPECASLRIGFPQFARNSLLTNVAVGLMTEVRLVEKHFYCEDCHFTWPKEGHQLRRNRPNMAPYYFIKGIEQTASNQTDQRPGQK